MWLCLNNGFLSVVKDKNSENFIIRSRKKEHLLYYFTNKNVDEKSGTDYLYRIIISKNEFNNFLIEYIDNINYSNFKDSIKDKKLKRLYVNIWYECVKFYGSNIYNFINKK